MNLNPVVLIATHDRLEITKRNIESLLKQTVVPKIVLMVSSDSDAQICNSFPYIHTGFVRNNPLGHKWQTGVEHSKDYNPNPLIITGSDDILGQTFIENACKYVENDYHFIGLKQFWQHHKGTAYLCDYKPNQTIGGGRVFSKTMLERLNYQLFDPTKDKHLDDYAHIKVRHSRLKTKVINDIEKEGMEIHAIKGDWPKLNEFNIRHKNIQILKQKPSEYL